MGGQLADTFWSVLTGVVVVAIVAVLTWPGSTAGSAVKTISGALAGLIQVAVS